MRQVFAATALAGALSLAAGGALPQPMTGPGGFMHGQHPGMMGQGLGFADPAGYLNGLKVALGITAVQEPAWNEYADTVKGAAGQMQGTHQTMFDAMGTATWQERRDMMNRMFEVRQASVRQGAHGSRQAAAGAGRFAADEGGNAAAGPCRSGLRHDGRHGTGISRALRLSAAARAGLPPSTRRRRHGGRRHPPRPRTRPPRCRRSGTRQPVPPARLLGFAGRCGR